MKRISMILSTLALVIGMAGSAAAVPVTWTDNIDFNPDVLIPPTYSYQHDITDSGFASLVMGGNDTIESFSLDLAIYDDNVGYTTQEWGIVRWYWIIPVYGWVTVTHPDGTEGARVTFGLESQSVTIGSGTDTVSGNLWGTLDLWLDGRLDVSVSSDFGDFYLAASTLTVNGDNGDNAAAPVPEPATMMLIGSGLLGLAGFRKKISK